MTKPAYKDLTVTTLPRQTAVERTKAAMIDYSEGRKNQARAFFNRVSKRKKARKIEKATRRKMRRK